MKEELKYLPEDRSGDYELILWVIDPVDHKKNTYEGKREKSSFEVRTDDGGTKARFSDGETFLLTSLSIDFPFNSPKAQIITIE